MTTAQDGTVVWRHYVKGDGSWNDGWALFLLDATGYFSVVSDYGNYAFRWTSFGECFRTFLMGLHSDYLLGKLAKKEYDEDGTVRAVKNRIIELRRATRGFSGFSSLSAEKAREEWDLVNELLVGEGYSGYVLWGNETSLQDPWEYHTQDFSSEAWQFAKKVWPRFTKVLREELEKEKAV